MRIKHTLGTLGLTLALAGIARAQDVKIIYPQANQDVRGEVTARFEGIPAGAQAVVRIDGNFKVATAQNTTVFDTISDRATFPRGDGAYKLSIDVYGASGGRVGHDEVTFNVANSRVSDEGESVRMVHWVPTDRLLVGVQRYRVFAESDGNIVGGGEGGAGGGGGAAMGGGGGGEGGGQSEQQFIKAPLDYQLTALLRRNVRDVGLYDNSANIATTVQDAFERGREGGGTAAGLKTTNAAAPTPRRKKKKPGPPIKGPWLPVWTRSRENGTYFIKDIRQNGTEINATRKAPTITLADLLPTFPDAKIRPGTTWQSSMTILTDLTSRTGINVSAPVTFTVYENSVTSSGETRRCAKIETRFRLPEDAAKRIAAALAPQVGGNGGGTVGGAASTAGLGAGTGAATAANTNAFLPEDFDIARTDMARVLWFDIDKHQIVRSEDTIRTYFEIPKEEDTSKASGGAGGGTAGGRTGNTTNGTTGTGTSGTDADDQQKENPTKVSYVLKVTTLLDDRIPAPNPTYTNGVGTAHGRDSVTEPGISRVTAKKP